MLASDPKDMARTPVVARFPQPKMQGRSAAFSRAAVALKFRLIDDPTRRSQAPAVVGALGVPFSRGVVGI